MVELEAARGAPLRLRNAAMRTEQTAKQRLARLRREVTTERVALAMWNIEEERREKAAALRAEKDRMFHRDLREALADEPRATEEEVVYLSELMNEALCQEAMPVDRRTLLGSARAGHGSWAMATDTPSWFKLFRKIDADGSGQISYAEWEHTVRHELGLSAADFSEDGLQRVWLSLDADCSGLITSGEFGAFMRMGEGCEAALGRRVYQPTSRCASERLLAQRREAARQAREELEHDKLRWAQSQLLSPDNAILQSARRCDDSAERLERELAALREHRAQAQSRPAGARRALPKPETPRRTCLLGARASAASQY